MREDSSLTRERIETIKRLLSDRAGLEFPGRRHYRLHHKINERMRSLGFDSYDRYHEYLTADSSDELTELLDAVSTNKSYFYREPRHWDYLRGTILPQVNPERRFNVWSAGCSSGEEPYTAALCLEEFKPSSSFSYRVLATDLSRTILSDGVRGSYPESKVKTLREHEPEWIDRYFESRDEDRYRITDGVRRHVVFREFNLNRFPYPFASTFDLIVCRNVFIYFDQPMIESVVNHLTEALTEGGYLFIGHTESIRFMDSDLERITSSVYRKTVANPPVQDDG